jgi:hypothetical protein
MIRKLQERMLLLPNLAAVQVPQALPHGRHLTPRTTLPPMPPVPLSHRNAVAPSPPQLDIALAQDVN